MPFVFEERPSASPWIAQIWATHSDVPGRFTSIASGHQELVITRHNGGVYVTMRGPETYATLAGIPPQAAFVGITFKLGVFMPHLPSASLVNSDIMLPEAAGRSFWLGGAAWALPTLDNADVFVARLARQGLLAHEPLVALALQERVGGWSARTVQRRVLRATGLTPSTLYQIERARHAKDLLEQGVPLLDVVAQAGYYDQPHMTRALRHLIGQTPARLQPPR